jgi:PAS domain S-box-containing protein
MSPIPTKILKSDTMAIPAIFSLPLAAYLQNTNAGLLVTDEKSRFIWVNQVFIDHFDSPATGTTIVNKSFQGGINFLLPYVADPAFFEKKLKELRRRKKPFFGQEFLFADKSIREISYMPVYDNGTFRGAIWQVVDVTKGREVQEAIKRNEEKFRIILDNLDAAMCETDLEGNITKVYDSFCRLSGYSEEELMGRNLTELFVPEENKAHAHNLRQNRIKEDTPLLYDMEIVMRDGTRRWVMASSANIYDQHGKIIGGAGIHMDITGQKALQKELEQARHLAEEAQRSQKEFLASMSHEIRTPLNAIIGMAHLLEETNMDAQQKEYVNILKHSSGILLGIISDILDISKIEAGELQVNKREFNLPELIQSLRHTFELKLGRRPVRITAEMDAQLKTWLVGDDGLLNQILLNLLGNAEKFTKEGEIALKVNLESWQENQLWIRFRVCDTGIGIKKDKLELIFKNYKQAEKDIREKYGGTGLGLAIAKQLVELQGGQIQVEDVPGYQTCFSFNLPFMDTGKPAGIGSRPPGHKHRQITFEDAKLLVVEDNPMNLRYVISLLERYKLSYQLATNGPDALYFLDNRQYDLILLDIRIPGMDGFELAKMIRANEEQPNVATPIIATTAVAMESTASTARGIGITDILTKPYTPDQLLQVLNKYLNEDETELIMDVVKNIDGFEFHESLDVFYLNGLYDNNISYAVDLFEIFLRTIKEELEKLRVTVENADLERLKFQVHKMKPNLSMVGLTWISAKMQELETHLRAGQEDHEQIVRLFGEIAEDVDKFYPIISEEYRKMREFMAARASS